MIRALRDETDLTTAEEFLHRFGVDSILEFREMFNTTRQQKWSLQDHSFRNGMVPDGI